ncbi:endonuclease domain-containing protein [bacterium]|nr:endonuclease domain-containing protein [bacterium]
MYDYNDNLIHLSRDLRSRPTDSETRLWQRLRRKQINGVQFYRQKPLGNYIVDFYAPAAALVIEVDGGQHLEPEQAEKDKIRDEHLRSRGLLVLRFDSRQVLLETEAVVQEIARKVEERKGVIG